MKITIISDNTVYTKGLKSEWGFSALVERENMPTILFDTGADGSVLLYNMKKLHIRPGNISAVFISHTHWDHIGGLESFLNINNDVTLYLPEVYAPKTGIKETVICAEPAEIYTDVFSTGLLENGEQSLIVNTDKGLVVIAGCSHPGVRNILNVSAKFGKVSALIGGLHGFDEFEVIKDLDLVCPTHCTQHKQRIRQIYPEISIEGGAGKVIEI